MIEIDILDNGYEVKSNSGHRTVHKGSADLFKYLNSIIPERGN